MSTFIDHIIIENKNKENNILLPITKERAVFDNNGVRLDYKMDSISERCENVEKKIHLVQTAEGTPNEIILNNIKFVDGFYTNFVIVESNDGLTTINNKPLYKPNTTQSPTLIKGEAVTAWYDTTSDCFFIKDSNSKTELPDNLVYFLKEEIEPVPTIPRDSDLLGGEPKSYYEQLVQHVADRVTANLNSINVLNNKLSNYYEYMSYAKANVDLNSVDMGMTYCTTGITNAPPDASNWFMVFQLAQISSSDNIQYGFNMIGDFKLHIRRKQGGTWGGWRTL